MGIISRIFKEEPSNYLFYVSPAAFVRVLLAAGLGGIIVWLSAKGLDNFVLTPMICGDNAPQMLCGDSVVAAGSIISIIIAIMMVPVLILLGIKRPLVVAVAAVAMLWGVDFWHQYRFAGLLLSALMYIATYAAIVWLNRIRGDIAAIAIIAIFVIIARIVLSL